MTARKCAPARERPPSQGYGGSTEARPNSARAKAESGAQGSPRATEPGCGAEPHVRLTRRELAILRSVVYGSLFDYPMTLDELQRTLVECDGSAADVLATFRRSERLRDVLEYRDMVTIIRDRVQNMLKKGATLEQVNAARLTADYDDRFGATSGPWTTDMFVEAVYTSLKR